MFHTQWKTRERAKAMSIALSYIDPSDRGAICILSPNQESAYNFIKLILEELDRCKTMGFKFPPPKIVSYPPPKAGGSYKTILSPDKNKEGV